MSLKATSENLTWATQLEKLIPLYGHRNWIVVADLAYPSQSRAGIETVLTNESQQAVVELVLSLIQQAPHIRPLIHVDAELAFVDESDAPGVSSYRDWLSEKLQGLSISSLRHDSIISRLDQAAQTFSITILKTTMTIPYTTVFFELDCAYWDAASESRLRAAMPT